MWKATEEITYKKEVEEICKSMEDRVIEICTKFAKGNVNAASLPAFWLGLQGDIDSALIKVNKKKIKNKLVKVFPYGKVYVPVIKKIRGKK